MRRAILTIGIPLGMVSAIACVLAILLWGFSDTLSYQFDTYTELARSGLIEKKIAPHWIPESTTDIEISFDFDLNIVSGKARYEFSINEEQQEKWLIGLTAVDTRSVDTLVLKHYGSHVLLYSDGTFLIAVDRRSSSIGWASIGGRPVGLESHTYTTGSDSETRVIGD